MARASLLPTARRRGGRDCAALSLRQAAHEQPEQRRWRWWLEEMQLVQTLMLRWTLMLTPAQQPRWSRSTGLGQAQVVRRAASSRSARLQQQQQRMHRRR
jgi:hypothetical protein